MSGEARNVLVNALQETRPAHVGFISAWTPEPIRTELLTLGLIDSEDRVTAAGRAVVNAR